MSNIVKHFIWKDGESLGKPINGLGVKGDDIEKRWPGVKYSKCTGLLSKGKRKNVHIESYVNSEKLRIYEGDGVVRESTDITLALYFTGEKRNQQYENFCEYISSGKLYYWDTMRKRLAHMIFVEPIDPKEDVYKGSIPYIYGEFKFKNLNGSCEIKELNEI